MLTELKLSNFRIFDDEITVRFRPITVFIGRNNSGKSSIIKFLLMLQQSLDFGGSKLLQPEGAKVQLGNFQNFKNSNTEKKDFKFKLTVTNNFSAGDAVTSYLESRKIQHGIEQMLYTLYATIPYGENETPSEHSGGLICDNKEVLVCNNPSMGQNRRLLDIVASPSRSLGQIELQELNAQENVRGVLHYNIHAIEHLGASRKELARVIEFSDISGGSVGQSGIYSLPQLQKIKNAKDSAPYEFILSYMQKVAGLEKIEFKQIPGGLGGWCYATNKVTGAESHIADFGFGVSQCMPIFVQGAIMPERSHLMVEQPEAQIHPTAQLEMGTFFYDLWKKRKIGSIIETHSDNVLLRLRRLIAAGNLDAKDVSVAYFYHNKDKGPVIDNLNINDDGTMQDGLPLEFFHPHLTEGLKLGARR